MSSSLARLHLLADLRIHLVLYGLAAAADARPAPFRFGGALGEWAFLFAHGALRHAVIQIAVRALHLRQPPQRVSCCVRWNVMGSQ